MGQRAGFCQIYLTGLGYRKSRRQDLPKKQPWILGLSDQLAGFCQPRIPQQYTSRSTFSTFLSPVLTCEFSSLHVALRLTHFSCLFLKQLQAWSEWPSISFSFSFSTEISWVLFGTCKYNRGQKNLLLDIRIRVVFFKSSQLSLCRMEHDFCIFSELVIMTPAGASELDSGIRLDDAHAGWLG